MSEFSIVRMASLACIFVVGQLGWAGQSHGQVFAPSALAGNVTNENLPSIKDAPAASEPAPGFENVIVEPVEIEQAILPPSVGSVSAKPPLAELAIRTGGGASASPVASISDMARALKNDPDLIYEYVRNNIEFIPIYGVKKGALGALLDGQGTSADQAELMVQLLQSASQANPSIANPRVIQGVIDLNYSRLRSSWDQHIN